MAPSPPVELLLSGVVRQPAKWMGALGLLPVLEQVLQEGKREGSGAQLLAVLAVAQELRFASFRLPPVVADPFAPEDTDTASAAVSRPFTRRPSVPALVVAGDVAKAEQDEGNEYADGDDFELEGADDEYAGDAWQDSDDIVDEEAERGDQEPALIAVFVLREEGWPQVADQFQREGAIYRHTSEPCAVWAPAPLWVVCGATLDSAVAHAPHAARLTDVEDVGDAAAVVEVPAAGIRGSVFSGLASLSRIWRNAAASDNRDQPQQATALIEDFRVALMGELARTARALDGFRVVVTGSPEGPLDLALSTRFSGRKAWPLSAVDGRLARPVEPVRRLLARLDPDSSEVGYARGRSGAHVEDVRRWLRAAALALPSEATDELPALTLIWPWLEAECLAADAVMSRRGELPALPQPLDAAIATRFGWTWVAMADGGHCYSLFDETLALAHDLASSLVAGGFELEEVKPKRLVVAEREVGRVFAYRLRVPKSAVAELREPYARFFPLDADAVLPAEDALWVTLVVGRGRGATWLAFDAQSGESKPRHGALAAVERAILQPPDANNALFTALRARGAPEALFMDYRPARVDLNARVVADADAGARARLLTDLVETSRVTARRDGRGLVLHHEVRLRPEWAAFSRAVVVAFQEEEVAVESSIAGPQQLLEAADDEAEAAEQPEPPNVDIEPEPEPEAEEERSP